MREKDGFRDSLALLNEVFPGKKVLSIEETAQYLNCDRRAVKRLIKTKRILAIDIGTGKYNVYRIPIREIAKLCVS